MKVNVLERLILLNILPKEGSYANIKLLRVARENLSFDEKENKELNFNQDGDNLTWTQGAKDKEIELGEIVTQMVVKELTKMDKEEKITSEHESLYEKFIA